MNGPTNKHISGSLWPDGLEVATFFAGLLVVVGLLMESGPEAWVAIIKRVWPHREVTGNVLVTIGVFAEVAIGLFIARSAKRAQLQAEAQIAETADRAAKTESANLQLRKDLETALAEALNKQAELEREQQRTANAQKEAAEAQLALSRQLRAVAEAQRPRRLAPQRFVDSLRGVTPPDAFVRIWYKPEDDESYAFAKDIWLWLGSGKNNNGLGWHVIEPESIPPSTDRRSANVPLTAKVGAQYGLSIILGCKFERDDDSSISWLSRLRAALAIAGGVTTGLTRIDPAREADAVVIVVGQKP